MDRVGNQRKAVRVVPTDKFGAAIERRYGEHDQQAISIRRHLMPHFIDLHETRTPVGRRRMSRARYGGHR
jgi:hypothetical protein